MLSLSQGFHRARRERNRRPQVWFYLVNAFGARVYGERFPSDQAAGLMAAVRADGTWLADGRRRAGEGSLTLLERGARVLSYGRLRETLTPVRGRLGASLKQEEPGNLTLTLSNAGPKQGRPFSRLEAVENLLGARAWLVVGYPELPVREWLTRFVGRVTAYRLDARRITLSLRAE